VELQDRVAIVTGGGRRLGHALCVRLAREGMHVCIHYGQSHQGACQTLHSVQECGRRGILVQADFLDCQNTAGRVVEAAYQAFGRVDVLVNSAAIFEPSTLASVTYEQFERHLAINLHAPWLLAQAFVQRLQANQQAHIVNILDWRALRPIPGHFSYTVSKAALWATTRLLALELAPRVQVNAIAPGAILPPADADPEYQERLTLRVPLRKMGSTDEVADALIYLLKSNFITGAVIPVTGGEEL
jgi:NAD(P)-dependent dehydrogenase (short-subunit alcohol dehydrogenase family)